MPRPLSFLLFLILLAAAGDAARAQLISPGRLIAPHAHLEGVTNCTSCHALGQRGIDPQRCLACHTPIRDRIRADRGFHATVAADCGTCHKDHFGRDFDSVRLDRDAFDHDRTGYPLVGEHRAVDCASCHRPAFITARDVRAYHAETGRLDRTFLGASTSCNTCHSQDNAHGPAFTRSDCSTCHSPRGWDRTLAFDHADTGFPLVGAHAQVTCSSCHGATADASITFTGLSSSCASCHASANPHGNQFAGRDCASCHGENAWRPATRFNHDRARFALTGSHRTVSCASCHGPINRATTFRGVDFAECSSCHADPHDGAMGATCSTCHTTTDWRRMAATFDAGTFDHDATAFPLVGAHATLTCESCHGRPARNDAVVRIQFAEARRGATFPRPVVTDCSSCHVDAHRGVFATSAAGAVCSSCHSEQSWVPTSFGVARHQEETAFPLTGGHVATPCHSCHGASMPEFRFESTACESCHADSNPHGDRFADAGGVTACGSCHGTSGWSGASFDHSTTRFPLTGAHASLSCQSCHGDAAGTDFAAVEMSCSSCHASDDPHRGQFPGRTCDSCHDTAAFTIASFDHTDTRFPLTGRHESVACASCHVSERAPTGEAFVRFAPMPLECASCHGGRR